MESAAGVFFEERQAAVKCLLRLLLDTAVKRVMQVGGQAAVAGLLGRVTEVLAVAGWQGGKAVAGWL